MAVLTIRHLIFTRVQPEYSPTRKNGFQPVYFSQEIKEDVAAIEKRVQCFIPTQAHVEQEVAEYQYFWIGTDKAVIVQTLPIASDPEVIDAASGRTGHFVSHALVINRDQFARIRNDPFAVIESASEAGVFTDSVETLVHYLREAPPPDQLTVKRRTKLNESLEGWTVASLEKWALMAQSADELTSKKGSLLLLSEDPEMVYALLSAALYLMDSEYRIGCTFNTFVDGCVPSAGMYWAVGSHKRVSGSAFTTIDLSSNEIEVKQQQSDPKTSPYSTWLRQKSMSYVGFSVGMPEIYVAQIAAECLATKRALPEESLLETALTTFREVNQERYQSGLMKALIAVLGKSFSEQIAPSLIKLAGIRTLIDAGAQEIIDPRAIAPMVYKWVVEHHTNIKAWNDLLKFAQSVEYEPLIVLAGAKAPSGLLSGNKGARASAEALDQLARKGELTRWLDNLQSILEVEDLLTVTTAPIIAAEIDPETLDDDSFVRLTAALIRKDGSILDKRYSARVRRLSNKQHIKELTKLIKKAENLESDFVRAIQEIS